MSKKLDLGGQRHPVTSFVHVPGSTPADLAAAATLNALGPVQSVTAAPAFDDQLDERLRQALNEARTALSQFGRATWQLAYALYNLKSAYRARHGKDMPKAWLLENLSLELSEQRVGQLLNTLAYYDGAELDMSVDFRVYEEARKLNQRLGDAALDKVALAKTVKNGRSVAAVIKALPPKPASSAPGSAPPASSEPATEERHELLVQIILTKTGGNWAATTKATFDGTEDYDGDVEWLRAAVSVLREKIEQLDLMVAPAKAAEGEGK